MKKILQEKLISVLSTMLCERIISTEYQSEQLQGGTLGDVRLVTGTAITGNGKKLPGGFR